MLDCVPPAGGEHFSPLVIDQEAPSAGCGTALPPFVLTNYSQATAVYWTYSSGPIYTGKRSKRETKKAMSNGSIYCLADKAPSNIVRGLGCVGLGAPILSYTPSRLL